MTKQTPHTKPKTLKEELQQRNRIETARRKTIGGSNQFTALLSKPLYISPVHNSVIIAMSVTRSWVCKEVFFCSLADVIRF